MSVTTVEGVPSMVMMPARPYTFELEDSMFMIKIPRKGRYVDLDSEFFDADLGEFNILDDNGVLYLPSIIKVLFACKKYPDLKDDQVFVPISLKFEEDEVSIVGQVVNFTKG